MIKLLVIVGMCLGMMGGLIVPKSAASAEPVELLVPLYVYPIQTNVWAEVAKANAQVPVTAVINPNSGPGGGPPNSDYKRGLEILRSAGVTIVGYVDTDYGRRSIEEIQEDIDIYAQYFNLHGIFFDQTSARIEHLKLYEKLYRFVRSRPQLERVILNPGSPLEQSFFLQPTGDVAIIFENTSQQWQNYPHDAAFHTFSAEHFAVLLYAVPDSASMRAHIDLAVSRNIGYIFLTDDVLPNPWDSLPHYWEEEVAYLAEMNRKYR